MAEDPQNGVNEASGLDKPSQLDEDLLCEKNSNFSIVQHEPSKRQQKDEIIYQRHEKWVYILPDFMQKSMETNILSGRGRKCLNTNHDLIFML